MSNQPFSQHLSELASLGLVRWSVFLVYREIRMPILCQFLSFEGCVAGLASPEIHWRLRADPDLWPRHNGPTLHRVFVYRSYPIPQQSRPQSPESNQRSVLPPSAYLRPIPLGRPARAVAPLPPRLERHAALGTGEGRGGLVRGSAPPAGPRPDSRRRPAAGGGGVWSEWCLWVIVLVLLQWGAGEWVTPAERTFWGASTTRWVLLGVGAGEWGV